MIIDHTKVEDISAAVTSRIGCFIPSPVVGVAFSHQILPALVKGWTNQKVRNEVKLELDESKGAKNV